MIPEPSASADLSAASLAFRPQMFERVIKQLWAELEPSGRAAETVGVACDVCGWMTSVACMHSAGVTEVSQ